MTPYTSSYTSFSDLDNDEGYVQHMGLDTVAGTGSHAANIAGLSDHYEQHKNEPRHTAMADNYAWPGRGGSYQQQSGHSGVASYSGPNGHTFNRSDADLGLSYMPPGIFEPSMHTIGAHLQPESSRATDFPLFGDLPTHPTFSTPTVRNPNARSPLPSQSRRQGYATFNQHPVKPKLEHHNDACFVNPMDMLYYENSSTPRVQDVKMFCYDADSADTHPRKTRSRTQQSSSTKSSLPHRSREQHIPADRAQNSAYTDPSWGSAQPKSTSTSMNQSRYDYSQLPSYASSAPSTTTNRMSHHHSYTPSPMAGRLNTATNNYTTDFTPLAASAPAPSRKKVVCPVCRKEYSDSSGLRKHQNSKHPSGGRVKKYMCKVKTHGDVCEKVIDRSDNLRKHWRDIHRIDFPENPGRKKLEGELEQRMRGCWEEVLVRVG